MGTHFVISYTVRLTRRVVDLYKNISRPLYTEWNILELFFFRFFFAYEIMVEKKMYTFKTKYQKWRIRRSRMSISWSVQQQPVLATPSQRSKTVSDSFFFFSPAHILMNNKRVFSSFLIYIQLFVREYIYIYLYTCEGTYAWCRLSEFN